MLKNWWAEVRVDAAEWCVGKAWQWRVVILIYCAYIGIHPFFADPLATDFFGGGLKGLTLAIHDAGHVIFRFAGDYICAAGGTINQLIVPIILGFSFYRQRDYFALSFAGAWFSFSLSDVAVYVGDASAMRLPLTSLGDPDKAEHDWHYLLGTQGLLRFDTTIAFWTHVTSALVLIPSLALGIWCIYRMITGKAEVIEVIESTPATAIVDADNSSSPSAGLGADQAAAPTDDIDLLPIHKDRAA